MTETVAVIIPAWFVLFVAIVFGLDTLANILKGLAAAYLWYQRKRLDQRMRGRTE